jgi:hypothetical protein
MNRCPADDINRVQLMAQFSQALAAGIHRDEQNSPQDAYGSKTVSAPPF